MQAHRGGAQAKASMASASNEHVVSNRTRSDRNNTCNHKERDEPKRQGAHNTKPYKNHRLQNKIAYTKNNEIEKKQDIMFQHARSLTTHKNTRERQSHKIKYVNKATVTKIWQLQQRKYKASESTNL